MNFDQHTLVVIIKIVVKIVSCFESNHIKESL